MYCIRCGTKNDDTNKFCIKCGNLMDDVNVMDETVVLEAMPDSGQSDVNAYQEYVQRKAYPSDPGRLKAGTAFFVLFMGFVPALWMMLYTLLVVTGTVFPKLSVFLLVYILLGLAYAVYIIVLACMGQKNPGRAGMCRGMIIYFFVVLAISIIFIISVTAIGAENLAYLFRGLGMGGFPY